MNSTLKITLIYLLVGIVWIFVSDHAAMLFFSDDQIKLSQFQTFKGLLYVGLTALLLYVLIRGYYKTIRDKVQELEEVNKKLQETNKELEQFAYVASHDLQEPLRMVSSFLTQLERKYHDRLDEKAQQYIYYAVDGSKRMQQMISDLLLLSRSGLKDAHKENVDLNRLVK
ncbi:histidine kinase dimerization/phospho-acceptor domain-containing protein, partial [uncultured Planktosalinus sp.]|uniref:sensor histidine kinase n=1 Tax=uncultured Planktosalinus sp. TaxID=1810935 RepID=UPI0030DADCF1